MASRTAGEVSAVIRHNVLPVAESLAAKYFPGAN